METILHISDTYFGAEGNSTSDKNDRKLCLNALLPEIKKLPAEWKPTIVCFTGDLVFHGVRSEYDEAKEWLDKLRDACELSSYERFVMCVGNHEVNRNKIARIPFIRDAKDADRMLEIIEDEPPIQDLLEKPFAEFQQFCETAKIPVLSFGKHKSHLVGERTIGELRFLVLNTAWFAQYSEDKKDRGKLWLGLSHLKHVEAHGQAPQIETTEERPITIALMHHPRDWLHEEDQNSILGRHAPFDYLAYRCHIILTGHTHNPSYDDSSPDHIALRAFHLKGGSAYAGADYFNGLGLIKINDNKMVCRTIKFHPGSLNHKWETSKPTLERLLIWP